MSTNSCVDYHRPIPNTSTPEVGGRRLGPTEWNATKVDSSFSALVGIASEQRSASPTSGHLAASADRPRLGVARLRLRSRIALEPFDATRVLQVATRYVALPYLLLATVATFVSPSEPGGTLVGILTISGSALLIAAAEITRVAMSRRNMPVGPWLVAAVICGLDVLVVINATSHRGLDGGLWLSLVVLATVGGTLLPLEWSVFSSVFGSACVVALAGFEGQLERPRLSQLLLATGVVFLAAPTASVFREVVAKEAQKRLELQVGHLELALTALTAVIQSMREGLLTCDAEGRIELWNRSLESLSGIAEFEAVGRRVDRVLVLETGGSRLEGGDHPCIRGLSGPVISGSVAEDPSEEVVLVTASGEKIPVAVSAAPMGTTSAPAGVVAVVSDVRREREMSRMREMLVSMVSHELRTPITTILGFAELVAEGGLEPKQAEEAAVEIVQAASRLEALVDDLLSSAALQRGVLELNKRPVSLAAIVERSLQAFPTSVRTRVRTSVGDEIVEVDPDRLSQVISNIVSNGLKYSEGPVDVVATTHSSAPYHVSIGRLGTEPNSIDRDGVFRSVAANDARSGGKGRTLRIEIRDRGIGIDEETMSKLFTMFSRSSDERVRQTPGIGLGLYIAKKVVELHGGTIEVETSVGRGTKFLVLVPC